MAMPSQPDPRPEEENRPPRGEGRCRLGVVQPPRQAQLHEPQAQPADAAHARKPSSSATMCRCSFCAAKAIPGRRAWTCSNISAPAEQEGIHKTRQHQREAYSWWERLRWYEKATVGMINGWCFGGAYGPLFGCDIAIASDDAQFGLSEINWAILPGGGASKVAAELMPYRKAMYHAMMGENLSGKQAAEQGLVTESGSGRPARGEGAGGGPTSSRRRTPTPCAPPSGRCAG